MEEWGPDTGKREDKPNSAKKERKKNHPTNNIAKPVAGGGDTENMFIGTRG